MTLIQKERIDRMSYEQMVRIYCFAPLGNPMFPGKAGDYFNVSMRRKKENQCPEASKRIEKE